jgi:rubrerythrin
VDLCSVWVTDDAQFERADALLVSFLRGDHAREFRDQNWRCPKCGENLEGQFTECWSCGARRPLKP